MVKFFAALLFSLCSQASFAFDPIEGSSQADACKAECSYGVASKDGSCVAGANLEVCNKTRNLSSKTQIDKIVKECISKCISN